MPVSDNPTAALQRQFHRKPVATLHELRKALGTRSRTTVFRIVRGIGYRTSFSHAGRFYTLADIPTFDARGLWFYRGIGFSKHGTLRATMVVLVDRWPAGLTHEELQAALTLRPYDTLRDLVQDGLLGREEGLKESLRQRRPERGPAQGLRQAIDLVLDHLEPHWPSLFRHVIALSPMAGGGIRLVERTNTLLEDFFHEIKHGERRRSGRKVLTQDFGPLPASAVLARNLTRPDYVAVLCGTLYNAQPPKSGQVLQIDLQR